MLKKLLRSWLRIEPPWTIRRLRMQEVARRIDVELGLGRTPCWHCSRSPAEVAGDGEVVWARHFGLGGFSVRLGVPRIRGGCAHGSGVCDLSREWIREGARYTVEREKQAIRVLGLCGSVRKACLITGMERYELHEIMDYYIRGLVTNRAQLSVPVPGIDIEDETEDSGSEGGVGEPVDEAGDLAGVAAGASAPAAVAGGGSSSPEGGVDGEPVVPEVPGEDSPVWRLLALGEARIETGATALKMLLHQVRKMVSRGNGGDEDMRVAVAQIRRYFENNRAVLASEISQCVEIASGVDSSGPPDLDLSVGGDVVHAGGGSGTVRSVTLTGGKTVMVGRLPVIPGEGHRCWRRILDGEVDLDIGAMSYRMLLSNLRNAIRRGGGSEESYRRGAAALRAYFSRAGAGDLEELTRQTGLHAVSGASG